MAQHGGAGVGGVGDGGVSSVGAVGGSVAGSGARGGSGGEGGIAPISGHVTSGLAPLGGRTPGTLGSNQPSGGLAPLGGGGDGGGGGFAAQYNAAGRGRGVGGGNFATQYSAVGRGGFAASYSASAYGGFSSQNAGAMNAAGGMAPLLHATSAYGNFAAASGGTTVGTPLATAAPLRHAASTNSGLPTTASASAAVGGDGGGGVRGNQGSIAALHQRAQAKRPPDSSANHLLSKYLREAVLAGDEAKVKEFLEKGAPVDVPDRISQLTPLLEAIKRTTGPAMDPIAVFSRGNATVTSFRTSPRAKARQPITKKQGSQGDDSSAKQAQANPFATSATDETTPKAGDSDKRNKRPVVKLKGLVWKKPRNQNNHPLARPNVALKFQLRFMELDDRGMLRYYMNAKDVSKGPDPRHQIDVTGCTVVPIGHDGKLHVYELYSKNGDKVVLGQESAAEAKAWTDCLRELSGQVGDRRNTATAQEVIMDAANAAAAAAELEGDDGANSRSRSRTRTLGRGKKHGSRSRSRSRSKSRDPKERGIKPTLTRKKSEKGQALAVALDTPPSAGSKTVGEPSTADDGIEPASRVPERKRSKFKNVFGSTSSLESMTIEDDHRAESSKKLAEAITKERAASKQNGARRSIVMLLLSKRPQTHVQDKSGMSALHYAVNSNDDEVLSALLDAHAPIDLVNSDGQTALRLARKLHRISAAAMLLAHAVKIGASLTRDDVACSLMQDTDELALQALELYLRQLTAKHRSDFNGAIAGTTEGIAFDQAHAREWGEINALCVMDVDASTDFASSEVLARQRLLDGGEASAQGMFESNDNGGGPMMAGRLQERLASVARTTDLVRWHGMRIGTLAHLAARFWKPKCLKRLLFGRCPTKQPDAEEVKSALEADADEEEVAATAATNGAGRSRRGGVADRMIPTSNMCELRELVSAGAAMYTIITTQDGRDGATLLPKHTRVEAYQSHQLRGWEKPVEDPKVFGTDEGRALKVGEPVKFWYKSRWREGGVVSAVEWRVPDGKACLALLDEIQAAEAAEAAEMTVAGSKASTSDGDAYPLRPTAAKWVSSHWQQVEAFNAMVNDVPLVPPASHGGSPDSGPKEFADSRPSPYSLAAFDGCMVQPSLNLRWLMAQAESSKDSHPAERRAYLATMRASTPFLLPLMRVLPATGLRGGEGGKPLLRRSDALECETVEVGELPADAVVVHVVHSWLDGKAPMMAPQAQRDDGSMAYGTMSSDGLDGAYGGRDKRATSSGSGLRRPAFKEEDKQGDIGSGGGLTTDGEKENGISGDGQPTEDEEKEEQDGAVSIHDDDGSKAALLWKFCEQYSAARGVDIGKLYLWIDYCCLDWSHILEPEALGKCGSEPNTGQIVNSAGRAESDGRIFVAQRLAAPLYLMCCDDVAFVNDMDVLTQAYSRTYLFLRWLTRRPPFCVVAIPNPSDSGEAVSGSDSDGRDAHTMAGRKVDEGGGVAETSQGAGESQADGENKGEKVVAEGFVDPRDSYSTNRPFSIIRIGPDGRFNAFGFAPDSIICAVNDPLNGVTKRGNLLDRVPIFLLRTLCFDPEKDPINFDNSCFEAMYFFEEPADLPEGWVVYFDDARREAYFYNSTNGITQTLSPTAEVT